MPLYNDSKGVNRTEFNTLREDVKVLTGALDETIKRVNELIERINSITGSIKDASTELQNAKTKAAKRSE